MTPYGVLRFLHVLIAIVAMGPHFASLYLMRKVVKDPESAPVAFPLVAWMTKFPKHGGMAMLLTGVAMVAVHPAGWALFKEVWLAGSLILFLVNVVYMRARLEPAANELGAMLEAGPVKAEQVGALARRVDRGLKTVAVILLAIIVLMVFRPTL